MHVMEIEVVDLESNRLRDVVVIYYDGWERSRGLNAPLAVWENFA